MNTPEVQSALDLIKNTPEGKLAKPYAQLKALVGLDEAQRLTAGDHRSFDDADEPDAEDPTANFWDDQQEEYDYDLAMERMSGREAW